MRANTPTDPNPRHRRGKTSITMLLALLALTGAMQATAVAPAAAMDDTGIGSECMPREWLPRGTGIDGEGRFCSIIEDSGGDGLGGSGVDGGSSGSGTPGGDQIVGEPIYVNDPLPECLRSAWKCLPAPPGASGPSSGRERYLGGGGPRTRGVPATKNSAGGPKKSKPTKEECESKSQDLTNFFSAGELEKYQKLEERGRDAAHVYSVLARHLRDVVKPEIARRTKELGALRAEWRSNPNQVLAGEISTAKNRLAWAEDEASSIEREITSVGDRTGDLDRQLQPLRRKASDRLDAFSKKCKALLGTLP